MVEVTVDAKPLAKLPYDPDNIPDAVKKRAAAVDALYSQNGSQHPEQESVPAVTNGATEPSSLQVDGPPPSPQTQESVPPTQPAPAAPSEDENADSWKVRFYRMQGQYTAQQKTIGEMQEQMTQLGNELLHMQRMPPQVPQQTYQTPTPAYLTEEDVQNYGSELIDVTQRAAMHAVAPALHSLEQQNEALRQRLAKEARRALDQAVEMAVPDYREIDRNPRWHRWLLGIDVMSGRVRQQLLNEAIAQASAPRVISFFNGFRHEEAATGHSTSESSSQQATAPREAALNLAIIAAPGRARPATGGDASLPSERPIYTRAQIRQLYEYHRRGAYVGREAEWARQDADIIAAAREGRVR